MKQSLWMLMAAFLFSVMAAFTKMGAADFGTMELVFYRSVFGVLALGAWIYKSGHTVKTPYVVSHLKRSFIGTLGMTCWFFSIGFLPLGTAMTLNYTSPLYMAAIVTGLALYHRKAIDPRRVGAVILGFVGVVLILNPELHAGQELPALVGLSSGLFASMAYIQIRQLSRLKEPEWRIVFYFSLFGVFWGAGGQLIDAGHFTPVTWDNVPALLGMAVTATGAQLSLTRAWGGENVLLTAVFQYSAIIFASIIGLVFFHEGLATQTLVGIGVILVAGVSASLINKKKKKS